MTPALPFYLPLVPASHSTVSGVSIPVHGYAKRPFCPFLHDPLLEPTPSSTEISSFLSSEAPAFVLDRSHLLSLHNSPPIMQKHASLEIEQEVFWIRGTPDKNHVGYGPV